MADNNKLRIVIIGAGSVFTRGILADIASHSDFNKYKTTVVLVDLDDVALSEMMLIGQKIIDHYKAPVVLKKTTDRTDALPGADFVFVAVERHRYELWEQDFRVPLSFGFKHVLGENGGPGAIFHALRNYEIVIPICKDIERLCPDATLLNFTNPEVRIVMAITQLTKVKMVGLCHGVLEARDEISRLLKRDLADLHIETGGINHFFWVLKVQDIKTGEDLYPELRKYAMKSLPPLARKMMEIYGYFIFPSDDHIGEYISFAHEFTGVRWAYGLESSKLAESERWHENWRNRLLTGTGKKVLEELIEPSPEIAIDIITDILGNKGSWRPSVNVPNTEGYIENLPLNAIVEVPATVDAAGVHPIKVGPIPEALAAFTRTQISIQLLLVEAYKKRSKNLLLQALLLDPVVDSCERAEKMLDYMLELQSEFLPEFV